MKKPSAVVMWIIWFAILQSMLLMQFFVGGGLPTGENIEAPMALWIWIVAVVPILIASLVRWILIPRIADSSKRFIAMLIGLVLTEQSIFVSAFLVGADYPQNQIAILLLTFVAFFQFIPTYAISGERIG